MLEEIGRLQLADNDVEMVTVETPDRKTFVDTEMEMLHKYGNPSLEPQFPVVLYRGSAEHRNDFLPKLSEYNEFVDPEVTQKATEMSKEPEVNSDPDFEMAGLSAPKLPENFSIPSSSAFSGLNFTNPVKIPRNEPQTQPHSQPHFLFDNYIGTPKRLLTTSFVILIIATVIADLPKELQTLADLSRAKAISCAQNYLVNKCHDRSRPVLYAQCDEWSICMQEGTTRLSQAFAKTIAGLLNGFFDQIGTNALIYLGILCGLYLLKFTRV